MDISKYVRCALVKGISYHQTHLMQGGTEANESRHDTPEEATKGNYVCSVVFVTKHATNWRCCGLHVQSVYGITHCRSKKRSFQA